MRFSCSFLYSGYDLNWNSVLGVLFRLSDCTGNQFYQMLIRKQLLKQVKDQEVVDYNPSHRISQTLQYKNSESIQEEEEHSSLSQICYLKPVFLQTCPQQPIDIQSSEDYKVPTITNIASHKSSDKYHQKSESKKLVRIHNDSSLICSSSGFQSQLLSDYKKKLMIDQGRVKIIVNQIKQKLLNSIHYSKYNDPLVTQERDDVSPLRYYYFTMYVFISVIISNLLTIIFIPITIVFDGPEIIWQVAFGVKMWTLLQDLYFQRGPYKLLRGKLITNFKEQNRIYLDSFRTISSAAILLFKFNSEMTLMTLILLLVISDLIRTLEVFENIYRSTHYIIFTVQLWIAIVVMCTCFLKMFNEEEYSLRFYLAYSISLITQTSNISMEITEQNSIIISVFMLISYLCYAYTLILLFVWIKPGIEIQEEKQKLLKGFVELFQEKCRDQDLLRRCYSYLDFRIDEDLGRSKDQLTKKLSPALQDEIELSLRTRMIDKIELMNRFSPQFKQQLLYAIEQVTFNPEDNIIIEHQSEDLGLYYILKGEVKVQFQGSSLANNKRSVTRLKEGQAFGQYSFISGVPSNISIFSCGVTTLMKLKRSEFLEIISNFPQDNELFCMMKDNSCYNQHLFDCYYCKIKGHYILECNHIQYFPQRQNVIEKHLYSIKQVRQTFTRKSNKYLTLKNLVQYQDKAKQVINKQSQDIMSEDLPEASQLPYSENQTYSVSYVSNSMAYQKASQDQQVSNSNVNVDSLEQLNYEQEQQEAIQPPILDSSIKRGRQNSNKTSHRTAGFVGNPQSQNYSTLDKDEKEILQQLQEGQKNDLINQKQPFIQTANRIGPNKLTFQFQKEIASQTANKQEIIRQDFIQQFSYGNLKQSLRQPTNRSHTFTNSYSKDISNYPSSNSRQNKSLRLSSQTKDNGKKTNSANTQSDENKFKQKSQRTGTKQSNLALQSQFQAITSPDNQGYFINDVIFNKFEKMKSYMIYYPHNNYDRVILRQQSFQTGASSNKRKRLFVSPYSIKCFVVSKIRRVQKLIKP
ncbi:unnamed protein product [Paramecium octaurelia]|uniref:Cyclic nucleotide-binding domain-containing protein n=1 Tax=Paramecium octaurelia TaxID=43137 RepID=A0A8S1XME4_PAROT|nr:unnamed protein product [Paramecium octaurelia]